MTKFFIYLGVFVATIPLVAWLFMLAVGVIHHEWLPMMPTIGYKSSLIVSGVAMPLLRLSTFGGSGTSSKGDNR